MSNALHLALEALENMAVHFGIVRIGESTLADREVRCKAHEAIAALRDAIEQKPADIPEGERTTLVGIKADGTQQVIGHARISPKMKAREIVRDMFGAIDDDGCNDAAMAYDCCEQLIDWLPKQQVVVLDASPQPAAPQPEGKFNRGDETAGTVKRFAWDCTSGKPEIMPATNGAFVWYEDYVKLLRKVDAAPQPVAVPHPGMPEAGAMIESVLAEFNYPSNTKNAARAGYVAAMRLLAAAPQAPSREPWHDQATVDLVKKCRAALAEELAAYDIDPPPHHVKEAHDDCDEWLRAHGITKEGGAA